MYTRRLIVSLLLLVGLLSLAGFIGQPHLKLWAMPLAQSAPSLALATGSTVQPGSQVAVPMTFQNGGASIGSISFALDFDQACLTYNSTTFALPSGFVGSVTPDLADSDSELDVVILSLPVTALPATLDPILTLDFTALTSANCPLGTTTTIAFAADPDPSFGTTSGGSLSGTTTNGNVTIGTSVLTNTPTATNTPITPTATNTPTNTPIAPTATATNTATNTPIAPTATATATSTNTPIVPTATATNTPTNTPVAPTATATATSTNTPIVPTATATNTATNTLVAPTATATATPTSTQVASTATATDTATNTPVTLTATNTPIVPTATATNTPVTSTATTTATSTNTTVAPTATATNTPTTTPLTSTATATDIPTNTQVAPTATATDTATNTPVAPTTTATATATATPTATFTNTPVSSTATPTTPATTIILSSSKNGTARGLSYRDEDLIQYEVTSEQWQMVFDGSDVGLLDEDVDAFAFDQGVLLLSVDEDFKLAARYTVNNKSLKVTASDILAFVPTQLGGDTRGKFYLYFDGSTHGLNSSGENIDAIAFDEAGHLLISVTGGFNALGVKGDDEDLFAWYNDSHTWSLYFDGSQVGLTNSKEDIRAAWVDTANRQLYLSTRDDYRVTGASGSEDDIFICTYTALGTATACTFTNFFDGKSVGFKEAIDGLSIGAAPQPIVNAADGAGQDEPAGYPGDDADVPDQLDGNETDAIEERPTQLFLPLVRR